MKTEHEIIKANVPNIDGTVYTEKALMDSMNDKTVPLLESFNMQKPPIGKVKTKYNKKKKALIGKVVMNKNQSDIINKLLDSNQYSIGCSYIICEKENNKITKLDLLSTSIIAKD